MFSARNRQNAFARRRKQQGGTEAVVPAPEASSESPAPKPVQMAATPVEATAAVPYDTRTAESADIVDAPDVSTFAAGGVVEQPKPMLLDFPPTDEQMQRADEVLRTEPDPTPVVEPIPVAMAPVISAETRAKVDAVLSGKIEPVEPQTAAETADEPKRGRGRPRPQETIDRDNAVHALLLGADAETGISKESLAAELDEKEQQVYSSLRQLTKEGRAVTRYVKPHGYRWFAV